MIKIVQITNAHQWDGIEMTHEQLEALIELLKLSNFSHSITYISNGVECVIWTE